METSRDESKDRRDQLEDRISNLPLDILIDHLFPALSLQSLLSLAAASSAFHRLIINTTAAAATTRREQEIIWRRRMQHDFNFPVGISSSAASRKDGWFALYRRMVHQRLYTFGSTSHGRLALNPVTTVTLQRGVAAVPMPVKLPASHRLIAIEAGGWSFHTLTSTGRILSWGCMDGQGWANPSAPLSHPSRIYSHPTLITLPLIPSSVTTASHEQQQEQQHVIVSQLSTGRMHVVFLTSDAAVYEYRSFGRIYHPLLPAAATAATSDSNRIIQVEAAWEASLALTKQGDTFIWWQVQDPMEHDRLASLAGEGSSTITPSPATSEDGGVIYEIDIDAVQLPGLRAEHEGQGATAERIVRIAAMDNRIIALSSLAKIYAIDVAPIFINNAMGNGSERRASNERLREAFRTGEREWIHLPHFSSSSPYSSGRITHITAHFHSFACYTVTTADKIKDSAVLIGSNEVDAEARPNIIPELQGIGVIRVSKGDHHWGALTSTGHLYTWGSNSTGALGLGHTLSQLLPHASDGFAQRQLREHAMLRHVERPTRVVFSPSEQESDDDLQEEEVQDQGTTKTAKEASSKGSFVFQITMGGSHSGVLAVDLSSSPTTRRSSRTAADAKGRQGGGGGGGEGKGLIASMIEMLNPFVSGFV